MESRVSSSYSEQKTQNTMKHSFFLPMIGIGLPVFLAVIQMAVGLSGVEGGNLQYEVPVFQNIECLDTSFLYLFINFFIILFPLLLSFDRKVAFYKSFKPLFGAILLVGAFFIIWDVLFTHFEVWGFNTRYYYSDAKMMNLPMGEWLFFITVPFACIFIFDCLKAYFPNIEYGNRDAYIYYSLYLILMMLGIVYWTRIYTAVSCFLTAAFLLYRLFYGNKRMLAYFLRAYLISWIPFIIFDGALTGSFTEEPIVLYNPNEFMGFRLISIPLEDAIYSFLLLLMNASIYDRLKKV